MNNFDLSSLSPEIIPVKTKRKRERCRTMTASWSNTALSNRSQKETSGGRSITSVCVCVCVCVCEGEALYSYSTYHTVGRANTNAERAEWFRYITPAAPRSSSPSQARLNTGFSKTQTEQARRREKNTD